MSDQAEKPFDPTPQRLEKARRDGDTARSAELGANVAFAAAAVATAAVLPPAAALAQHALTRAASGNVPWFETGAIAASAAIPACCALIAGTAAGIAQNGGFVVRLPVMKPERLNPVEGCKRMLSRETVSHALRAAAAFALAAAAMIPAIAGAAVAMADAAPLQSIALIAWHALRSIAAAACIVGAAFALGEYAAARSSWLRRLRMSIDERKRELKDQEGDPLERGRRRALHRSLVRGAIAEVKKAAFVVANPTHVAVALEYAPPGVPVPKILVRAAGTAVARVRALACEQGIPVVENVALARALYRDGHVGHPIDRAHFVAVAEVVAALYRAGLLRR